MVEKFLEQTTFTSQEDFIKNLKIKIPENFNFGYDIVDAWAAEEPDKKALLWTNDKGEHIQYTIYLCRLEKVYGYDCFLFSEPWYWSW